MNPITKYLDDSIKAVDKALDEINTAIKANDTPTFEPDTNLGEGKATGRNLEYRKQLLTLLKETVYLPVQDILLKKGLDVEARISLIDKCISDYISAAWKLVESPDGIPKSYNTGLTSTQPFIKKAAEKKGITYKATMPKQPQRLTMMINMQKRSVEDKALVLRGRLRSSIDTEAWMGTYGNG